MKQRTPSRATSRRGSSTTSRRQNTRASAASSTSGSSRRSAASSRSARSNRTSSGTRSHNTSRGASSGRTDRSATSTTDHEEIQQWVESHGGHPAAVKRTTRDTESAGILRIDFPGFSGEESLKAISWDEWFKMFERRKLAFLYQKKPKSRFNKLVSRDS